MFTVTQVPLTENRHPMKAGKSTTSAGRHPETRTPQQGFTLIELMVAIAVLAILISIGIPAFRDLTASNQMRTGVNDLVAALHYAKAEAVSRGERVVLCKGTNTACQNSGDWTQGWAIFEDADADGVLDSGELLMAREALTGSVETFIGSGTAADNVTFTAGGRTTLGAAQRFVACDHRGFGAQARVIHVTVFGTTTVHKATDISGLSACQ